MSSTLSKSDFSSWWQDFALRFPTAVHWFAQGRDSKEQSGILGTWLEILALCSLADLLEANRALQDEGHEFKTVESIPVTVRRQANAIRLSRRPAKPQHEWDQERFDCPLCMDRGQVTVWTNAALSMLQRDGCITLGRGVPALSAVCRCSCERGEMRGVWHEDDKARDAEAKRLPIERTYRFANETHCLIDGYELDETQQQQALAWLAHRRAMKNPLRNGNADLASFNRSEF